MRTFTVMLDDDENTLLMGMLQGVPWNDFGFNLVAVADNGQDALELIKEIHPDLLISDIRSRLCSCPALMILIMLRRLFAMRCRIIF